MSDDGADSNGIDSMNEIKMVFRAEGVPDRRRYNRPTNESEMVLLLLVEMMVKMVHRFQRLVL